MLFVVFSDFFFSFLATSGVNGGNEKKMLNQEISTKTTLREAILRFVAGDCRLAHAYFLVFF